jgi:adenosylcobinamide-GDP ribazoletransferase
MKQEIRIFFTALMFYTRIPCPKWVDHAEDYINKATRYFPFIGFIVAAISLLVYYSALYVVSNSIAVFLMMAAGVLTTGAFHEDGFADVCDGFGGGWTKEKILDIMKDSRVGAYGVIGLIFILITKYLLLLELSALSNKPYEFISLVALVFVASRWMPVTIIYTDEYSREDATSKVKPVAKGVTTKNLLIATLFLILALSATMQVYFVAIILPLIILKWYLSRYFNKWINGYTGDCLGAAQQLSEIVTLISILFICRFI